MRRRAETRHEYLDRVAADVAERAQAVSAAYRGIPRAELEAGTKRFLAAVLEAAASSPESLDAFVDERIAVRAGLRFAPDDLLAFVDAAEAALADASEEQGGRAELQLPAWSSVLAALDRARSLLLARLGLFDAPPGGSRIRRLVHERRIAVLLAQLLRARADERARLGRELHDGAIQSLTAGLLRLDALRTRLARADSPEAHEAGEILATLRSSLDSTRGLVFSLRAGSAGDGLSASLPGLLDRFAGETGVDAELVDELTEPPPPDVELLALQVLEEALANVELHARARHVAVRVSRRGAALEAEVSDDGLGFRTEHVTLRGLSLARARTELAGGELTLASEQGAGTTVRLTLPAWA